MSENVVRIDITKRVCESARGADREHLVVEVIDGKGGVYCRGSGLGSCRVVVKDKKVVCGGCGHHGDFKKQI